MNAGHAPVQSREQIPSGLYYRGPGQLVPIAAMEAVLAKRCDQIFLFGHTLEQDAARPLREFAVDLKSLAGAILEDVQFNKSIDQLERHTVKLGALALAMFDRLQAERSTERGKE